MNDKPKLQKSDVLKILRLRKIAASGGLTMSDDSIWEFEKAKSRFSEIVELAQHEPQIVSKDGQPVVAIINVEDYQKWQASRMTVFQALMPKNGGFLTDQEADTLFKRDRDNRLREIDFE